MASTQSLTLTQVSQSLTNNTSQLNIKIQSTQGYNSSYNWGTTKTGHYWVSVNGGTETQYSFTYTKVDANTTNTLANNTITVNHANDGTAYVYVRCEFDLAPMEAGNVRMNETKYLDTIQRASSCSIPVFECGSSSSINIYPANSSYNHVLTLTLGSNTVSTNVNAGVTTSSLTPSISWCNSITTSSSSSGTLTITTFNGNNQLGSISYTVTINIPSSLVPSVSATLTPINGFNNIYLSGRSTCQVVVSASSQYSATISSYSIILDEGGGQGTSSTWTTPTMNAGTHTITIKAVDTRGRSATITKTLTVVQYDLPTVSSIQPFRCRQDGTSYENGTYASVKASWTYSSSVSGLTCTCKVQYREHGIGSYSAGENLTSGVSFASCGGNLLITKSYDIRIIAEDSSGATATMVYSIYESGNYLYTAKKGKICFGGYVDNSLSDGIQVEGDIHLTGSIDKNILYYDVQQLTDAQKNQAKQNLGISVPEIKHGKVELNDDNYTLVSFNYTFSEIPDVVLTPNSNSTGIITAKIKNVSKTGFYAIIGGTASDTYFHWVAIN